MSAGEIAADAPGILDLFPICTVLLRHSAEADALIEFFGLQTGCAKNVPAGNLVLFHGLFSCLLKWMRIVQYGTGCGAAHRDKEIPKNKIQKTGRSVKWQTGQISV